MFRIVVDPIVLHQIFGQWSSKGSPINTCVTDKLRRCGGLCIISKAKQAAHYQIGYILQHLQKQCSTLSTIVVPSYTSRILCPGDCHAIGESVICQLLATNIEFSRVNSFHFYSGWTAKCHSTRILDCLATKLCSLPTSRCLDALIWLGGFYIRQRCFALVEKRVFRLFICSIPMQQYRPTGVQ